MERVGTFQQSQVMLAELMRTRAQEAVHQRQVATGKVAQSFKELPREANSLLSAKAVKLQTESYIETGKALANRLEIQNLHLESLSSAAADLRQAVTDAVSLDDGVGFADKLQAAFSQAVNALNAKVDGKFLFNGGVSDTAPVTSTAFADLVAAANEADVFAANDGAKATARLDDSLSVEHGMLAEELGLTLMGIMKRLGDFNAGPNGPIDGPLTDAQRAALEGELGNLRSVGLEINAQVAANGVNQQTVDRVVERHQTQVAQLTGFIGDIEDVDMAQAVTNLNNDQIALEATAQVLSRLNRITLLDFI